VRREKARLAAIDCRFERLLPALTRGHPAIGVDIEENIVETLLGQPIAQSYRSGVVRARMADEQSCHDTIWGRADGPFPVKIIG
jgi:hypothetical protein